MKQYDKRVSIIIPVFNTENYLDQCLESVHQQTYDNIEIILINDGSTDKSTEICLQWCGKGTRFFMLSRKIAGRGLQETRVFNKLVLGREWGGGGGLISIILKGYWNVVNRTVQICVGEECDIMMNMKHALENA